jgi:membrane protein implicated in regulation of membrane protease activity
MLTVFQICFFVGIGLILLSFLFGSLFDAVGIDGLDLDFDFVGLNIYLPISPVLMMLFLTVFGGVGWILVDSHPNMWVLLVILIGIILGFLVCSLVFFLVMKPLKNAENTSAPNPEELVGIKATVSETILNGGFGEIRYVVNGNSFTSPAKATNGSEIKAGKDVAICWIESYVFYVASLDDI